MIFDLLVDPFQTALAPSKMSALKTGGLFVITALIASLTPPCNGQSEDCPREWFTTQFTAIAYAVVPVEVLSTPIDSDFIFFRDTMFFSDERVMQDAMEFFDTRFGLDFSQSTPNAQGQRTVGNAVLSPFIMPPEFRYTVKCSSMGAPRTFASKIDRLVL